MKCQKIAALVLAAGSILNTLPAFAQETSVYEIKSKEDLFALKEQESVGSVRLCADLDLSGMNAEQYLIPSLAGTFDGGGHTISNLKLAGGNGKSSNEMFNTGLIGELSGTVLNLNLENVTITGNDCTYNNIGTIAGSIPEGSVAAIDSCTVTGTINFSEKSSLSGRSYLYVGAIAGGMKGSTAENKINMSLRSCTSDVTIHMPSPDNACYSGGLLGRVEYHCAVQIDSCAALGDITSGHASGLLGYITSAIPSIQIDNSYYAGTLKGSKKWMLAYTVSRYFSGMKCRNYLYDNDKNKAAYSWESVYIINNKTSLEGVTGYSTADLMQKASEFDGFEIRPGEFNGYPVPKRAETAPDWGISFSGDNAVVSAAEDGTYYVIFAAYKGKTLKSAAMIKNTFTAGETTVTAPSAFVTDGADTVRAMLLDSPETLHPLTPAATK